MRKENEMFSLIKSVAENDGRIKAAALCGSRADKTAPRDIWQDYDIEFYVEDMAPFFNNITWLEENFGKIMLIQTPDIMDDPKLTHETADRFAYLTIFEDGVRIDLTIKKLPYKCNGEPCEVILDKCGCLDCLSVDETCFNVKTPNHAEFSSCCNEFWWCLNNVAKGLARDEIPYALEMYNSVVRPMLNDMISWYIGVNTDFSVSSGKMGKYFKRYLPDSVYAKYLRTYSNGDSAKIWTAVIHACKLFSDTAKLVAESMGFEYNITEENGLRTYMMNVKNGAYR